MYSKNHLPGSGLSIDLECPDITLKITNVIMSGNSGGNIAILFYTFGIHFSISVEIVNSIIECGHAPQGGGMCAEFVVHTSLNTSDSIPLLCQEKYQYHISLHISTILQLVIM